MNQRHRWFPGAAWAAVLLLLAIAMPRPGGWTIDDGVKRAAAGHGRGVWAETIPDGKIRAQLWNPADYAPYKPPFAYRAQGGVAPGFSPLARAYFKVLGRSDILLRIAMAAAVILLWVMMERAGFAYAFLLLPLTFYGLVPWEHGLSWVLLWPAVWAVVVRERAGGAALAAGGALIGLAALLRPETLLLAVGLGAYLMARRDWRGLAIYGLAGLAVFGTMVLVHSLTAGEPLWVHVTLNEPARNRISWIQRIPAAAWVLLAIMDNVKWISAVMLTVFLAAVALLMKHERRPSAVAAATAWVLLAGWLVFYQYRLWTSPLPPLAAGWSNSLLATMPWVVVLARPPYRGRPALWIAAAMIAGAIAISPAWHGVHWGPRMVLFALPLLVVDLHRSGRLRGPLMTTMLALTVAQTLTSAALAYARHQELADRNHQAEALLGSVVVTPSTGHVADLAPLWEGREFFTTATEREFRQLMMEFRAIGVDSCWLHVVYWDPMYRHAFPLGGPVTLTEETRFSGGTLYKTSWRIFELALNRADTMWAGLMQGEAGRLLHEGRGERALSLQRQAAELTPLSAQAHHNLALVHAALGQLSEARAEVQRALDLDPDLREARRLLMLMERHAGENP